MLQYFVWYRWRGASVWIGGGRKVWKVFRQAFFIYSKNKLGQANSRTLELTLKQLNSTERKMQNHMLGMPMKGAFYASVNGAQSPTIRPSLQCFIRKQFNWKGTAVSGNVLLLNCLKVIFIVVCTANKTLLY